MISILIPLFNGIEFLQEAITSINSQTFTDWECLIGVNGYNPNSKVYHQAFKFSSNKIHIYDLYECKSVSSATNALAKLAKGDHVALLDADDTWESEKLEEQSKYLNHFDVVGTKCRYFCDSTGEPYIPTGDITNFDFFKVNPIINSSCIIKKELFLLDECPLQDYDLWLRLRLDGRKFFNVDKILVNHRIHQDSSFNSKGNNLEVPQLLAKHSKLFTTVLSGGLGNRLFQVAFGLGMQRDGYKFVISQQDGNAHSTIDYNQTIFKSVPKMDIPVTGVFDEGGINEFSGCKFRDWKHQDMVKFVGNFQNEKYFENIKGDIIERFTPQPENEDFLKQKYPLLDHSYFIHYRGGDYTNHPIWDLHLEYYYERCLKETDEKKHFYIFSNDPIHSITQFSHLHKTIVVENELDSLWLMSKCKKGGICGNSTFSWWGAYLNTNPNKKVYMPDKWLNQVDGHDWNGFKPDIWPTFAVKIETEPFIGCVYENVSDHKKVFQEAEKKGEELIMVMESDIVLHKQWKEIVDLVVKDYKWDTFLLGCMGIVEWGSFGVRQAKDLFQYGAYLIKRKAYNKYNHVSTQEKFDLLQEKDKVMYYFPFAAIDKKDKRVWDWMTENFKPHFNDYYDFE